MDLSEWTKRFGPIHYSDINRQDGKTLCGKPMLGNNYTGEEREKCDKCTRVINDQEKPTSLDIVISNLYKASSELNRIGKQGQSCEWVSLTNAALQIDEIALEINDMDYPTNGMDYK